MPDDIDAFLRRVSSSLQRHSPTLVTVFEVDREVYAEQLRRDKPLAATYGDGGSGDFAMGLSDVSTVADMIAVVQASWYVYKKARGYISRADGTAPLKAELEKSFKGDRLKQAMVVALDVVTPE